MDAAGREGVSRKARLAGKGWPLCKRRNAVDDPFPTRPKGAPKCAHAVLPPLTMEPTIACGRRLAWTHLGALHSSILPCWATSFIDTLANSDG